MTKLLKAEEVRDRLELRSVATVYKWARDGRLPSVILSAKAVRFREEDVEAFIEGKRLSS
jgi:excisionase family DNA binding protein